MMITAMALLASLSVAQTQQPQQPQQPQTPGTSSQQSSQTTVVVPPPPGQQPVVIQPQDRPLAVAPCPPAEMAVRRERRDPVVTVLVSTLAGGAAGALFGTGIGLANGDNTSHTWERDIGTGTVIGLAVGATAGAVLAVLDYNRDRVAVAPFIGGRSAGLAVAGRW